MLNLLTKRNIARDRFGASAAVYGAKGGKVCSDKKKAAGANSLRLARYAKMVKAAERGEMFMVLFDKCMNPLPVPFVGSRGSCEKYCRKNSLALMVIHKADASDIPKP